MNPLDKINTLLLCDIIDHLGIESDHDTAFVRAAIYGGHGWALAERYGDHEGHQDERRNPVVETVHNVLRLWGTLEDAYERFDEGEKAALLTIDPIFGKDIRWPGFDGNNEAEYLSVARFMIEHMDWYPQFKERADLNSHMPTLASFERMWPVFMGFYESGHIGKLTPQQVGAIVSARRHPDARPT